MREKPTVSPSLGLTLNSHSLKGAELTLSKGKPKLEKVFEIKVDENVKPLYMGNEEKNLRSLISKSLVGTALHTHDVLVRPLEIKLTKEKDIDAVLDFQAEPLLPYSVEHGVVDRIIISQQKESSFLTVLVARKDHLGTHLEEWQTLDIEPEVVSCEPAALAAFSSHFAPTEETHIICHLGMDHTSCCIVEQGKLKSAQAIRHGIAPFGVEPDFGSKALENYRLEITKILLSLSKNVKSPAILFTGEGASIPKLPEFLNKKFNKTIIQPKENSLFPLTTSQLQKYAIPIGVALTTLPKAQNQVNFRQQEYAYPDPWKRTKKPLVAYLMLCVGLAITISLFSKAYVGNQGDRLKQEYIELLVFMKKPYLSFEAEFDGLDPKFLTQLDIHKRLTSLDKAIKATPDVYPLLPNVPRVSDVLAWLSTHPIASAKEKQDGTLLPRMQLQSFSYKMVKRPNQNKKKEKYQVKVDLEFTTPVPRYAREFNDALRAPNEIVDLAGEIKWSADEGKYRASFFLKDKTYYPK